MQHCAVQQFSVACAEIVAAVVLPYLHNVLRFHDLVKVQVTKLHRWV
jgi:hypothetical protein